MISKNYATFKIQDNPSLEKISEFPELDSVINTLIIARNEFLSEISGFNGVENFECNLEIFSNKNLVLISGF